MKQPNIKLNYIYRTIYEILIVLIPLITTPYVSRVLGADGVGIYSYTSSIMTYFTLFAALGTATYGEREIARNRDNKELASKLFFEIELLTIITSSICILIWIMFILLSVEYRYYYIALMPLLFSTMADISWFFSGYEQMKYIVLRNSLCKIVGVILLFSLVNEKNDLVTYMIINSVISLVGNLSMWTYLPKMIVKVDLHTLQLKKHFKETLIYFIPTIATSIYTVLDKTLIGIITQDSFQNGYYEQATKIINIVKSVVFTSLNVVMGARISYLFMQKKYDEIKNRIERSISFIFLLGYGSLFGIIAVANEFVPLFFGESYEPVISLLYVMSPLIIIIGISNCLGTQYYTPAGLRLKSAKIIILGSFINLVCNLILIPKLGANGAAIGSLIAELSITILYVIKCDGYLSLRVIIKYSYKRIIAGVIMLFIIKLVDTFIILDALFILLLEIIIGLLVYFVVLFIMKDSLLIEMISLVLKYIVALFKRGRDNNDRFES